MMRVEHNAERTARKAPHIVFAVGFFDGVHRGHQAILTRAREIASAAEIPTQVWAMTFFPHPASVFAPDRAPALLTTHAQRLERLASQGLDGCLILPFTREFAALSPEAFVSCVLAPWMQPDHSCTLVSGPNWTFGRNGEGTLAQIPHFSGNRIGISPVPFVPFEGAPVSSSRIRTAIAAGEMERAGQMLGAPYTICEQTLPGPSRGIGTSLGAPTANILPKAQVLPRLGVYALNVRILSRREGGSETDAVLPRTYRAVANFGLRPTFPEARPEEPLLEIHLLGYSGEPLYQTPLEISFLRYLRPEQTFASPEALAAQIRADIQAAATALII